jgi:protein O-mannosyl-transferase
MTRATKQGKKPRPHERPRGSTPHHAPLRLGPTLAALGAALAITFASYTGAFDNAFVDWDDPDYVEQNPLVQQKNYGALWRTVISNNWHPLTMFSLAANASVPLSPKPFLVTNVIVHVLNTGLVFWLALLLSGHRLLVAFFVSALFGIHPMHVESVAWISERKDVLYTLFFLGGSIAYWRYLEKRAWPWLASTFALFVLSCLSKGMAVVFPLVMILLDSWKGRLLLDRRALLEKAPFFATSLLFGLIALDVQAGGTFHGLFTRADAHLKGLADSLPLSPLQRFALPAYGHMMYLVKLFLPLDLSSLYPYPRLSEASHPVYLLAPLVLLATVALAIWARRRMRFLTFGIGWYFATIVTVLQWVPVGEAIMADRYTYLPYFGLFFALAMGAVAIVEKRPAARVAVAAAGCLFLVFLFARTVRQVETWKDSETLWTNVIRLHPESEMAYVSRGNHRGRTGRVHEAMSDLQTALRLGSRRGSMYDGLGNAYGSMGMIDSALVMFDRGLQIEPGMGRTHYNRAIAYLRLGRPREALADLDRAGALLPFLAPTLHVPRGNAYLQLQQYREAATEYDRAIATGVRDPYAFYNRGIARMNLGDPVGAAQDLEEARRLNPAVGSTGVPGP